MFTIPRLQDSGSALKLMSSILQFDLELDRLESESESLVSLKTLKREASFGKVPMSFC